MRPTPVVKNQCAAGGDGGETDSGGDHNSSPGPWRVCSRCGTDLESGGQTVVGDNVCPPDSQVPRRARRVRGSDGPPGWSWPFRSGSHGGMADRTGRSGVTDCEQ